MAITNPTDNEPSRPSVRTVDDLIDDMRAAETRREWSHIVADHIKFGNDKLANTIAVFNIGSATDCPNLNTPSCQVGDACYALKAEQAFPGVLPYRRRQEYLWDALPPDDFAAALLEVLERARTPVDTLRLNEAGDFRHQSDVVRADHLAGILADHGIRTYVYTACDWLDFSDVDHMVVNASNPDVRGADRRYVAVHSVDDVPDGAVRCPHDIDRSVDCGDCTACMDDRAGDVYTVIH